jgi:hypothetical protein
MQMKETYRPSLTLVGFVLQAWYVKMLTSQGLVALVKTFPEMSGRRAVDIVDTAN